VRAYLKILSSIIAALLSWASIASAVSGVTALVSDNVSIVEALVFPFLLVWAGFMMFGITGSVFWFVFLSVVATHSLGPMKRQILAACVSTLACWLIIGLAFSGGEFKRLLETATLLVFMVPVVAVSLAWYWFLYLRTTGKAS